MCLVALAHQCLPRAPLVLVANRDERHARPTAPMAWWPSPPLLAGRDLEAGGTWFAVDRRGRFAVVTNVRGVPTPAGAPSRGTLVPRFVAGELAPLAFLAGLEAELARYAGFNLVVGDGDTIGCLSNADGAPPRPLGPGVHALSNGVPGSRWPKVRLASRQLAAALATPLPVPDDEALLAVLGSREPAADADLPETGVGPELERALSAPFIVGPGYGTRSTTVLVLRGGGRGHVLERSYDAAGAAVATRRFGLSDRS